MAVKFLAKSAAQRRIRRAQVDKLATAIREGRWRLNGQPIIFDEEGFLLDGQHRLSAIVASGESVPVLIVEGVAASSFDTIDTGIHRGLRDVLDIEGVEYAHEVASGVPVAMALENQRLAMSRTAGKKKKGRFIPDVPETHAWFNAHPIIVESARLCATRKHARLILGTGNMIGCHYVTALKDRSAADDFFTSVNHGEGMHRTDPPMRLREKMGNDRMMKRTLSQASKCGMILKAWNAFRRGEKLHQLRWNDGDEFPGIEA